jgi:single-strand DNA-binding protein
MNTVVIDGFIGDVETRFSNAGLAIAKFSVSVNNGKKQPDGSWSKDYHYFDCVCFGQTAESTAKLPAKSRVLLAGKLQQEKWQDKQSGANRSKVSIIVESIAKGPSAQVRQPAPVAAQRDESGVPLNVYEDTANPADFSDDVPF